MTQHLARLPDWRSRFHAAIDALERRKFDWSKQDDCALGLAGDVVLALTGKDIVAPWRGKYTTAKGALALMREEGFKRLPDLVASLLPEIHPSRASIGDIVAIPATGTFGWALGVANGERILVMRADGLATRGLLDGKRAFRVG